MKESESKGMKEQRRGGGSKDGQVREKDKERRGSQMERVMKKERVASSGRM